MTFAAVVVCAVLAQAGGDAGAPDAGVVIVEDAGAVAPAAPEDEFALPPSVDAGTLTAPPVVPMVTAPAAGAPVTDVPAAAPSTQPVTTRVTLNDGQVLVGTLVEETDYSVTLRIGSGDELLIPRTAVKDVRAEERAYRTRTGSTWFEDANRTRYFYGPSAMMLKKGEVSFSQYELLISSLSYGVTDNISLQAGAAVPFWFVPPLPQGFNLLGAVKVGFSATELTHFAVGAQALALPAVNTGVGGLPILGVVFGTATYGQRDAHASVSLGAPFMLAGSQPVGPVIGTLSGNYRVSELVALVTENWLIFNVDVGGFGNKGVVGMNGVMARIMGERIAADVGAIVVWDSRPELLVPIPIPWLAFTYNFL